MRRTNIVWKDVPRDNSILRYIEERANFTGESETAIIKGLLYEAVEGKVTDKPKISPPVRKKPTNDGDDMLEHL